MASIAGGILLLLIAALVFASPMPLRRSRRNRHAAGHSEIDGEATRDAVSYIASDVDAGSDGGCGDGGGCGD
jgi:hypothetical protein